MDKKTLSSMRILFTVDGCPHCRQYLKFIEKINMKLPPEKMIKVVDCSDYIDFGVTTDSTIVAFKKYLDGGFPVLFFNGMVMSGAVEKEELEMFISTLCLNDFVLKEHNPYIFNKDCQFVKRRIFGAELICN